MAQFTIYRWGPRLVVITARLGGRVRVRLGDGRQLWTALGELRQAR